MVNNTGNHTVLGKAVMAMSAKGSLRPSRRAVRDIDVGHRIRGDMFVRSAIERGIDALQRRG